MERIFNFLYYIILF